MLSGSAVALMDKSENVVVGSVVASYFPVIFFVGFILDIAGHAFCDGIICFFSFQRIEMHGGEQAVSLPQWAVEGVGKSVSGKWRL